MIVIPFFGDQYANAKTIVEDVIGLFIDDDTTMPQIDQCCSNITQQYAKFKKNISEIKGYGNPGDNDKELTQILKNQCNFQLIPQTEFLSIE